LRTRNRDGCRCSLISLGLKPGMFLLFFSDMKVAAIEWYLLSGKRARQKVLCVPGAANGICEHFNAQGP
jgi:hypothetical protein